MPVRGQPRDIFWPTARTENGVLDFIATLRPPAPRRRAIPSNFQSGISPPRMAGLPDTDSVPQRIQRRRRAHPYKGSHGSCADRCAEMTLPAPEVMERTIISDDLGRATAQDRRDVVAPTIMPRAARVQYDALLSRRLMMSLLRSARSRVASVRRWSLSPLMPCIVIGRTEARLLIWRCHDSSRRSAIQLDVCCRRPCGISLLN